MKNRDRFNKLEDIGFFIAMAFASLAIGFSIIALLVHVMRF